MVLKYGFLGDIHGNLGALTRVLEALDHEGVEQVVSVGDVVGYGAAPAECIELLREREIIVVKGNHDAACTGELSDGMFNPHARAAVRWTRGVLTETDMAWLRGLPMTYDLAHAHVSHGTLYRPEQFGYIQSTADADPSLDIMSLPTCFVGHTHVPVTMMRLRQDPMRTAYTLDDDVDLSDAHRTLVNVGSVGQPRDEDPRTGYALYDVEEQRLRIVRIEYDIEAEAARIRAAGLPGVLADRLFLGL